MRRRYKEPEHTALAPELQARLDKAQGLRKEAETLEEWVVDELKTTIAADLGLTQNIHLLELSIGDCTGKYGTCIYDDIEDPAHDDCLICHQPYERK
jgi:hypothetical protein